MPTGPSGSVDKPKVLVVDDEIDNVELLHRTLHRQYEVLSATSGAEALKLLATNPEVALILTDQRMPAMSGVELLVQSLRLAPDAVRMILTGYTDYQDVLAAINHGHVNRFLLKPIEPDKLVNGVKEALEVYFLTRERQVLLKELERRNIRLLEHEQQLERLVAERTGELRTLNQEYKRTNLELEAANARLSELALRDGLTGLYNHRYFQEHLSAEVARSRRHAHPLSLLFVDIDHFKRVNDTFGHPAGDQVLVALADLLIQGTRAGDVVARVRGGDVVARYGGEEFALILPETSEAGARIKAENIRKAVAEHPFRTQGDKDEQLVVTVSIGVSSFPLEAVDAASLIRRADKALYRAKDGGRNRVCCMEEPAGTE